MLKKCLNIILVILMPIILSSCLKTAELSKKNYSIDTITEDDRIKVDPDNPDRIAVNLDADFFDTVELGTLDGKPITWYIIISDDEHQILMSKYIIDTKPYNEENVKVEWSDSTLYDYLNSDFFNECFNKEEQEKILFINEEDDARVTMPSLNNLIDLYGEIFYMPNSYYGDPNSFDCNPLIIAKPTARATYNEIEVFDNETFAEIMQTDLDSRYNFANGAATYWVLDTDEESNDAYYVSATGFINHLPPNTMYIGFRPIIRIKSEDSLDN